MIFVVMSNVKDCYPIPHNGKQIKASNVSNLKFNQRQFFIIFCLEDPHSHTTDVLVGITHTFCPSFNKNGQLVCQ